MKPEFVIRNTWYVAGLSADFPMETLSGQVIAKRPIVMWRTKQGRVVAFDDRCAHKRFPLSKGRLMPDGTLQCAYHGLRYDASGAVVQVPSLSSGPIPRRARTVPFPVKEQDGLVWIWPGDPALSESRQPPRVPEVGDDAWETAVVGPMDVPANYLLLIENLLDISHFYPLHDGNIGDEENSRIPVTFEEGEEGGHRYVMSIRKAENYRQPSFLADWFGLDVVDRHHTHCMMSPGITRVVMRNAPPGRLPQCNSDREFPGALVDVDNERGYVLIHTHTPVDELHHVWRVIINCPVGLMSRGTPPVSTAKRIAEMFPEVAEEDLWVLKHQQDMFDFEDEGYVEVFLKPDQPLRRARLIFTQMRRAEANAARAQAEAAE